MRARLESLLAKLELDDGFLEVAAASLLTDGAALPARIGAYEIDGLLGSGGMGVVYRATHPSPRRPVALKVLHAPLIGAAQLRRFEHETELLGRLQHPGIARIIELGWSVEHGLRVSYIAMELVEGEPVTRAADARALGVRERVQILARIADAVHHAHLFGVVHRDLKPSNVLLDAQGWPKVIDFGVARALDRGPEATVRTRTGQVVGTLAYMSPEQVSGEPGGVDARTDVYSLGVLAYELLAGRRPHELFESSITRAARIIQDVEPARLGQVRPGIDRDLEWIVAKALAKEPAQRYQSAAALSADLARYLRGEAVEARPPSTLYQLSRLFRRKRAAFIAAGVALFALVAGGGLAARYALVNGRLARQNTALAERESLARAAAEERAERSALYSDADRLTVTLAKGAELLPAGPGMAEELDEWLQQRAEPLRANLPLHEARLAEQRARARPVDELEQQERHDAAAALVSELRAFFAPETGLADRVARARVELEELIWQTHASPEAGTAWRAAAAEIAAMGVYGGLELAPQVGLLPLRPDPHSGLWEFWHPQTGSRPLPSDAEGMANAWVIDESTGLVFVLVPGGPTWVGEQSSDPYGPNYFSAARRQDAREVEFAPFFLSKYELTQAQWQRVTGENPSEYDEELKWYGSPARAEPLHVNTWWNPVERVSWLEATRVLDHLGLRLPTGAEWEYGARGGTSTPWWTGSDPRSIEELRAGNLADAVTIAAGGPAHSLTEDWLTDGWVVHAPVGTFAANPFGLHDVIGNLWEWCQDEVPPDGRMVRSGGYAHDAMLARSAWWDTSAPDLRVAVVGVRPARSVE